ncbi:MAG TPA: response regulator [Thermoanaerobaculia bacterium]|nr:response regulator [Thermoanaerobaculia bacterium]
MAQSDPMSHAPKMLVIDDDASILLAFKKYFSKHGFTVEIAREREEAEALIATTRYVVVIADVRLTSTGSREGVEILRFIRSQSRGTLVVILTAHRSHNLEAVVRHLGANAFLQKPAALADIANVINSLMDSHA